MTNSATLGSFGDASNAPLVFRNKLINGGFDIWQRGTSQTSSGYGSDDRWSNLNSGSTKTASQQAFTVGQTDVPGNPRYFSRTVVSSVAGSTNYAYKIQGLENVSTLSGQTVTLSFWAKADSSKNIAVEFVQNFGTGGAGVSTAVTGIGATLVALTSTWKYFTVTVAIPSISGKTLGTNNDHYLGLNFWFDAGSSFNARTNSLGQQSGTFDIAQVQLEQGLVATPFEQRPFGMELLLCQRYFWCILYDSLRSSTNGFGIGLNESATVGTCSFGSHPTRMRTAPSATLVGTILLYGTTAAGATNSYTGVSINANRSSQTTAAIYFNFTGAYVGGSFVCYSNVAGSGIFFDAEL